VNRPVRITRIPSWDSVEWPPTDQYYPKIKIKKKKNPSPKKRKANKKKPKEKKRNKPSKKFKKEKKERKPLFLVKNSHCGEYVS